MASTQTSRLQLVIDSFPTYFADDTVGKNLKQFADSFRSEAKKLPPEKANDAVLNAACNELEKLGRDLQSPSGEWTQSYAKGSDEYTDILRAYAKCFRRLDDLITDGGVWNFDTWLSATKDTFRDIGDAVGKAGFGTADILKWAAIGLIAVAVIVVVTRVAAKA